MTDANKEWPRLALTAAIIAYFGYAIFAHWTTGIEETVKNTTMLAVGFWLGSSKGSADSSARTDKALDIAQAAQSGGTDAASGGQEVGDQAQDAADVLKPRKAK